MCLVCSVGSSEFMRRYTIDVLVDEAMGASIRSD